MPKKIDWMYERKNCMTCKKARGFLETINGKVVASEDATKVRYASEEAKKLLEGIDKLVAMKGTKVTIFNLKKDPPDDETLFAHLIGPTGNLRAPTAKVGKTMMVGFNEATYKEVLGVKEE